MHCFSLIRCNEKVFSPSRVQSVLNCCVFSYMWPMFGVHCFAVSLSQVKLLAMKGSFLHVYPTASFKGN